MSSESFIISIKCIVVIRITIISIIMIIINVTITVIIHLYTRYKTHETKKMKIKYTTLLQTNQVTVAPQYIYV